MFKETTTKKSTLEVDEPIDIFPSNGLEEKTDNYKKAAIGKIKFNLIIKPAIISFVALIISFFLDISYVPLLGNITVDLAKGLFPTWQPATEQIIPYSFWWLPVITYGFFIFIAYLAYKKLSEEVKRTPASETIDRIITSYTSVIDSISTALPLIGAAILLISIQLGEEVFLGLSVPFEIKALIILAIGKLFEPVLDQLGVEFQNVVTHLKDFREKYFSRLQIESSKNLIEKFSGNQDMNAINSIKQFSVNDLEKFRSLMEYSAKLSELIVKNFASVQTLLEQINSTRDLSSERITEMKEMAQSIAHANNTFADERTITGLKHFDSIINKNKE